MNTKKIINNLKPYLEADEIEDNKAPVRACHRYLSNRTNQIIKQPLIRNFPLVQAKLKVHTDMLQMPGGKQLMQIQC
jgi:hypothetical protein